MANDIETSALELSDKVANGMGVYVVDVSYAKNEDGDYTLCYSIDKEGGVGIDDCEAFSRSVEEILDKSNIISDKYVLEVTSPGVDRQLKTDREFNYYIGREVDVKLYAALDGLKEFSGVLKAYNNGIATILYDGKDIELDKKQAVYIKLAFRF